MQAIDYAVLAAYLLGTLWIGIHYRRRNRRSVDMFAAGRLSPWWVSGLSGFMTLKSAGTFVVWGGLAYREGVVAIAINTCIGVSGLLVGAFVAGRWRRTGVVTPAEFVQLRFGNGAVQFTTWSMLAVRLVSTGIALYALAVILVALVPLDPGHPLRDDSTGHLSLAFAIVLFGAVIITYTVTGGLWAVLMTDVVQFIVLFLSVLFVIPLLWIRLNEQAVWAPVPSTFFEFTSGPFTGWFLAGWIAVHFFVVGAEWAYAQRYLCVPSARDARRSAWLFGALFLISPTLWLLPPLLYRLMVPDANPEQAYILASQSVLPVGMVGLMVAAMFSASASAISGQINVFAGVITEQFYRRLRPADDETGLVLAGRWFALAIGTATTVIALLIPAMGGAEQVVLTITGMVVGPLLAPTIWGLWSGHIGIRSIAATAGISLLAGLMLRFGTAPGAPLAALPFAAWAHAHPRSIDILVGAVFPVVILACGQLLARRDEPGWRLISERVAAYRDAAPPSTSPEGESLRIVALALGSLGIVILLLAAVNESSRQSLLVAASVALLLAASTWLALRRRRPRQQPLPD